MAKSASRSKRAIVVDSLTELVQRQLENTLDVVEDAAPVLQQLSLAEVAEKVAKGLVAGAWDLDHHPVNDRISVIWDVPE